MDFADKNQDQSQSVIYNCILDPVPSRRIKLSQGLNTKWVKGVKLCAAAEQLW